MKRVGLVVLILGVVLAVAGCQSPLRFEGLYRAKMNSGYSYLRFYQDGTVLAASSAKGPKDVVGWFDKDNIFTKGYYSVVGNRLKFTVMEKYSIQEFSGLVTRNRIKLSKTNGPDDETENWIYRFIPLDVTPDYGENSINLKELPPETERILVYQTKRDIDGDGKLEQIILDDDKQGHKGRPDHYRRILIFNAAGFLMFDSRRAGLEITGVPFRNTHEMIKIEDNNKNGLPEIYLQDKPSGGLPGRVAILESDRTEYRVLMYQALENFYFMDFDHDGKQEIIGETGSSAWELLFYRDKTVFKRQGTWFLPSFELTWQLMDDEQNQADEDFTAQPGFEKFLNLITLDAVMGLIDEGINLIKANVELEKEPTNVATTKDLLGNFEDKLQKYDTYWNHLKSVSECYGLMSQINDLYQQKRYGDTLELALKAATISKQVFGVEHLNTAATLQNLAVLSNYIGKERESAAFFKEAAEMVNGILNKNIQSFWDTPSHRLWCDGDFILAGLSLGMKEKDVIKLLGKPAAVKRGAIPWRENPEAPFKDLLYKGITVRLVQTDKNEDFKVQQRFLIKSPRYPTLRGIKTGDSYQKVLLAYGEPSIQNQLEMGYQVLYPTVSGNSWKQLTFQLTPQGMVESIIVGPVQE